MKHYEVAGQTFRTRKAAFAEARLQDRPLVKVVEADEVLGYLTVPPPIEPPLAPTAPKSALRELQDAILAEAYRLDYSMHTVVFPGVTSNITLGSLVQHTYPEWEADLRSLLTSLQTRVYNPNVIHY